jgi:hypothetical protein
LRPDEGFVYRLVKTDCQRTLDFARETRDGSATSGQNVVDAGPIGGKLLGDTKQLLALVATFEQPSERRRRVLQAMRHVDLVLELSRLDPAGESADRLCRARHIIEKR